MFQTLGFWSPDSNVNAGALNVCSLAHIEHSMSKEEIADVLGISSRTVENWVNDGIMLTPIKLGNRVYWHPNVFYA